MFLLCIITTALAIDWTPVQATVQHYRSGGAFTGGILRVSNRTHALYNLPFGSFSHNDLPFGAPSMQNETIFDLASVTKVTATLSCVMRCVDLGLIKVQQAVSKYIPEYGNNGKQGTLVKNLLLHNAGLLPDYPGTLPSTKKEVMDWTYNCTPYYTPGTKFVYSDLSFILLGQIVERVTAIKLQVYARTLMEEMEMWNTSYLPSPQEFWRIAPTEYSLSRKHLIRGEVHDPTAYLFKGVAGHAGFFSTVADMEKYMQTHLNKGVSPSGKRIFKQSTEEVFWTKPEGLSYNNTRALGWDTVPVQTNPPCGHYFSPNSFGHTGYTGTSIWADRDKDLIVILLTQRVHPTSLNLYHVEARSFITDAIVRALGFI